MLSSGINNSTTSTPLHQIQQQQMHNVSMPNVSAVGGMSQSQIFQQQQFLAWQQIQQQNPQQQQFFQQQHLQRSKKQQIQHQQSIMHSNSGNLGGLNSGSNNMSLKADWNTIGIPGPNNMASQMSNNIMNSNSNTSSGSIISMQQSSTSSLGLSTGGSSHIKDESKHNLQLKILQRMSNF